MKRLSLSPNPWIRQLQAKLSLMTLHVLWMGATEVKSSEFADELIENL